MINYYAYPGNKTLEESKSKETNTTRFKSGNSEFAIKLCNKKFGENKYKLFSFTDFNDTTTFKEVLLGE